MTGSETHSTRSPSPQTRSSLWRRERRAQSSVRTARWNWNLVSSHSISFGWFVHQNIQPSPTTLSTNFFISPPPTCVSWRSPLLFTWRTRPGHGSLLSRTCEWPSPPCHQGLKKICAPRQAHVSHWFVSRQNIYKKSLILNVTGIICGSDSGPCSFLMDSSLLNFCFLCLTCLVEMGVFD